MKSLNLSLKWQWLRGLAIWNRLPIRAQGGWLALIPVAAILLSFAMAFYGNRNREAIEIDIERKFSIVNRLNEIETLIVDAETGMRGYMLVERGEFLEPYRKAMQNLPPALEQLWQLSGEEPEANVRDEKLARFEQLKKQIDLRLEYLSEAESAVSRREPPKNVYLRLQQGKALMDELRQMIGGIEAEESRRLDQRLQEINFIRRRDYIIVISALVIGLLARVVSFYLFDRGIVRRIERLTENARCVQKGESFKFPRSGKTDALGRLEDEIECMSQIFQTGENKAQSKQ